MKIWHGYGSEHSANLVIIGHFKSEGNAAEAKDLIETAIGIAMDDQRNGRLDVDVAPTEFSSEMLGFLSKHSIPFTHEDAQSLLYDHRVETDGSDVIVTTEDVVINGLMNILVNQGAKLEVYSAHMHPSKYGRQTFGR